MSVQLTPSKRASDQSLAETNGKGKSQKSAAFLSPSQSVKTASPSAVLRLLCPASRIGSVIGKGGSMLSQIRQESGAIIRVENNIPGCDERIVTIIGSEEDSESKTEKDKELHSDEVNKNPNGNETEDPAHGKHDSPKESDHVDGTENLKGISSVQRALFLVFERMSEGTEETGEEEEEKSNKLSLSVVRLLVPSSQVGCILGKGGSVIKKLSADSGAQIRILPRDKLPVCASSSDEIVQITAAVEAVRKALELVSQQLLEHPPRENEAVSANPTASSHFVPSQHGAVYSAGPRDVGDLHTASTLIPRFRDGAISGRAMLPPSILTFRLLCQDERVGAIIGKGGSVVKTIQQETGCEIKVVDDISDSEECIILISGAAHPDDRVSPVQDAVLRVQTRIGRAVPDSKDQSARILVSSSQIGCLLGKGGSIITEMRKSSGAYIRILGKDHAPKCASEDEEVVQMNGEFEAVQDALLQITSRLQHHFFRDAFPSLNHTSNSAYLEPFPPYPPYMGRRELSPSGIYSNLGPPIRSFEPIGGQPPHAAFHPFDDHPTLLGGVRRSGLPPQLCERKPWRPQGVMEGGGSMGVPDFPGGPPRRAAGFPGWSQPIITSTTLKVFVPSSLVPVICGEDGECLTQICQISDAKINIGEPKAGEVETVIVISGTPEQTYAAQSLIQAFVTSETESS